jgi:hypothetical protein
MGFIITKRIKYQGKHVGSKDKTYYYLVEGYREGKKVKRKTIYSLRESKNLTEALKALDKDVQASVDTIKKYEQDIEDIKQGRGRFFGLPWRQYRRLLKWIEDEKVKIQETEEEKVKVKELISKYPNCCAK